MLKLIAVGDICPGDKSILGLGICSLTKKHGVNFPFKYINGLLTEADIVLGNLEGLLSHSMVNVKVPNLTFCGLPSFAQEIKRLGFNVINVANNHTLEHGPELFSETVRILEDAGIKVAGLRDSTTKYYSKPVVVEKQKIKVGILGYNWVGKDKFARADHFIAQSQDSIVNYTWHRDKYRDDEIRCAVHEKNKNVINDIKTLKTEVDYVILMTHWGYEFVHYPPYGVTLEARSFIDAGADLIIGGHPHVLQGMEIYKDKWIFYSLGNFIFDMRSGRAKKTAILNCRIGKSCQTECEMTFLKLNKYFQPSPVNVQEEKEIASVIYQSNDRIVSENACQLLDDDVIYKEFERQYNKGKFYAIIDHFKLLPSNPMIIKLIFRKLLNFLELIWLRMRGEKIRW